MQTAHCINNTSPVELHYCLRTKCMLSEVAPMLLHGLSCVSGVFSRFFGSVFHLFEDLEWYNCEKKQNMGNVVCV